MHTPVRRALIDSPPRGYSLLELLVVVGMASVIAAISVPLMAQAMADYRLSGDARGVSSAIALAKMRAASAFSQSRFYLDLEERTYRIETLNRVGTPTWMREGAESQLGVGVTAGFASLEAPPEDTQTALAQASACRTPAGVAITGTACIVFNSRGIPVDSFGTPTSQGAIYLTDGVFVYAATVQASGMVQLWRSGAERVAWTSQ